MAATKPSASALINASGTASSSTYLRGDNAWAEAGGGKLISRKYASYATYTSTTSVIPMDDTIPQITEGVQIMTVTTDTLASSSNRLRIAYGGMFNSSTTGSRPSLAIFDGASNALHAIMKAVTANNTYGFFFHGEHEYAPGATTAKTITCRAGTDNASYTLYFNGSNGARYLGGAQSYYLIVDEIEP